ncbi:MAG: tetratricopeptide repeat protein [Desulfobacteraceae bacterium]|nr:tetratricopeptide repeat protein [Desulfobacteraceae bacterium]
MKRIFFAALCLLILISCASSSTTNIKNRKIAEAVYQEGRAYFGQKRYSIALGKFLEAEKTIKDDRFLQYDIGFTYYLRKKYNTAEIYFRNALELEPDFMPAANALGVVYLEQKQWDKAINSFNQCLNSLLYITPHYALTNLGWANLGKKNYNLAKDYFLQALKKSPNYSKALHGFATVCLELNCESVAIAKLQRASYKLPESLIIHYDIARIYEKLGQYSEAKQHWKKVIDLAPEGSKFIPEAKNRLKQL